MKVLDFGLAKALDTTPEGDPSQSPTVTAAATQMGVIMGTAAYMSPEQAAGQPADKRSDVWSFGVVLFEMLTGHRPFTGETLSHVRASVLKTDPEWTLLGRDTPEAVLRLLRRSLNKERKRRLPDIADAVIELEDATGAAASAMVAQRWSPSGTNWRPLPYISLGLALACAVLAGVVIWGVMSPSARTGRPSVQFAVEVAAASGHVPGLVAFPRTAVRWCTNLRRDYTDAVSGCWNWNPLKGRRVVFHFSHPTVFQWDFLRTTRFGN